MCVCVCMSACGPVTVFVRVCVGMSQRSSSTQLFVAGAASGVMVCDAFDRLLLCNPKAQEAICVQPFDMVTFRLRPLVRSSCGRQIKTRFQLNSRPNSSILSAFRSVVAEGGVLRFHASLLAASLPLVVLKLLCFAGFTEEFCQKCPVR